MPSTPLLAKTELVTIIAELMAAKEQGQRYSLYLLYWYKRTCFTGTKVQILTLQTQPLALAFAFARFGWRHELSCCGQEYDKPEVLTLLALLVQKGAQFT
jgi:hypothetical protein